MDTGRTRAVVPSGPLSRRKARANLDRRDYKEPWRESKSYIFRTTSGLSVTGTCLEVIAGKPARPPATILLDDGGKSGSAERASWLINSGEQVLATDLSFMRAEWQKSGAWGYEQIVNAIGERPLGIEAAELIAIAKWMRDSAGGPVAVETSGIRSQTIALVAAALDPRVFSRVSIRDGMKSFAYLIEKPVPYSEAHDLFCLDLFRDFDLDRLAALANPVDIRQADSRRGKP